MSRSPDTSSLSSQVWKCRAPPFTLSCRQERAPLLLLSYREAPFKNSLTETNQVNCATLRTGEATLRRRIINTTATGADQAQPKAYLSSKLSQITVSPSADHGPWPLLLRQAYVYVFLPLCSEPLCLTPLASHLSLSATFSLSVSCTRQQDSDAYVLWMGKINNASAIYKTHLWDQRTGAIKVVK